uniref:Si:ch211-103n10.5 n=1 Tax=Sparus aurata TaxID=8175 RepID=A0A671UFC2_SPAAU
MSSPAAAAPLATPAKSPKKRARPQKKKTGPSVSDLILKAVSTYTGRGGMSLAALKKALKAGGYDVVKNRARIVIAIRRLVANKSLVQTKGSGASGSFKLNKKQRNAQGRARKVTAWPLLRTVTHGNSGVRHGVFTHILMPKVCVVM